MKFTDRRDFLYDSLLFRRNDTVSALKIYADYVSKSTPLPKPLILEVDRASDKIDTLWHVPLNDRTSILRELEVPMIVKTTRQKWSIDQGLKTLVPKRSNQMTMANIHLEALNYFPQRGDFIIYGGYRNLIVEVEIPPESYWMQTNVWMGLVCHCEIAVEGDAKPLVDSGQVSQKERSSSPSRTAE